MQRGRGSTPQVSLGPAARSVVICRTVHLTAHLTLKHPIQPSPISPTNKRGVGMASEGCDRQTLHPLRDGRLSGRHHPSPTARSQLGRSRTPHNGDGRVEYYMYTCMNAGAPLMSGAPSPLQCSLELSGPPPTFCAFSLPHSLDHTVCPPASQPGPHTLSLSLSTWPISLSPTLTRLLQRHCGHHRLRR